MSHGTRASRSSLAPLPLALLLLSMMFLPLAAGQDPGTAPAEGGAAPVENATGQNNTTAGDKPLLNRVMAQIPTPLFIALGGGAGFLIGLAGVAVYRTRQRAAPRERPAAAAPAPGPVPFEEVRPEPEPRAPMVGPPPPALTATPPPPPPPPAPAPASAAAPKRSKPSKGGGRGVDVEGLRRRLAEARERSDWLAAGKELGEASRPKTMDEVFDRFNTLGLGMANLLAMSPGRRVVRVSRCMDCARAKGDKRGELCDFVAGFLAGAFEEARRSPVEVVETRCCRGGDTHCEFTVAWVSEAPG